MRTFILYVKNNFFSQNSFSFVFLWWLPNYFIHHSYIISYYNKLFPTELYKNDNNNQYVPGNDHDNQKFKVSNHTSITVNGHYANNIKQIIA